MKKEDSLSEFLKTKRINADLTQMEVARSLGYSSAQFISNWERGISQPPIDTIKKLCSLYSVKLEDLYDVVLKVSIEQVKQDLQVKFFGPRKGKGKKVS
ncbi:MAG: helix-turn-helix transcriptional regulator [Pseudobdellovibrionaceae bacterium]